MTRRETVLVTLAGVVAIIGLGSLVGQRSPVSPIAPAAVPGKAVAAQVATLRRAVKEAAPGPVERNFRTAVETPWREKAFLNRPLPTGEAIKQAVLPRYSGYVELGSGRLAVIDGLEYQAGDTLESGEFKVLSIRQEAVVLERLADGRQVTIAYEGKEAGER